MEFAQKGVAKKTNEAWFGDTFNRGTVNAYVPATGELCFSANNCTINADTLNELTGYITTADCAIGKDSTAYTIAKGCASHAEGIAISAVDTLSDQLDGIKVRLGALEEAITTKKKNNVRSGLKTLNYRREVE